MIRNGMTIKEATELWVREMDAVQLGMIQTLMDADCNSWHEVTKPSKGDRVYVNSFPDTDVNNNEYDLENNGEVIEVTEDGDYIICLDNEEETNILCELDDFNVTDRYDSLPMWGTMWSFHDSCDDWWLEKDNGLQLMSDCGFRIYEHEEWGYFFGIDGCGYDFYEAHWIPLYKVRGLRWHDEETCEKE